MAFDLQPTLEGELLRLRPLREDDWAALFAVASDPLIWEQHPARDRYQEPVFREYFREAMECGGAFAIIDRKAGDVIGSSRFIDYDEERSEIEIGYTFLARAYWGGTYNREMKDLLLRHAFRFVQHVVFLVGPQNFRSQKAMEKIGGVRVEPRIKQGRINVVFQIDAPARDEFLVRRAGVADAAVIARHRVRMFHDMDEISDDAYAEFLAASQEWTERGLTSGEYIGWLAASKNQPDYVVGGAGVQLRQVPPHPCRPSRDGAFAKGRHAIVLNVFTEPEWRKRGVGNLLMEEVMRWAHEEKLDRLVLHASDQARSLYEKMGFIATNEMRYGGELKPEDP
ncbi:MAG TPA: GNAT family N-acetyltransferase [Chthoniobacterales bacterium]|jgi:RimJ/RimL family protein N-acetyltransferase|nr:GNAT family N-acetyltransferase [Chthoniobacterales bacterium]